MDKGVIVTCVEINRLSTLHLFLDLPAEIIELILNDLDPSDILALRSSSHELHDFIHQTEGRVVKILHKKLWSEYRLDKRTTIPEATSLTDFFDTYRRHNAISLLAGTIADHISQFSQRRVPDRISIREERVRWRECLATRLRTRLTPGLIMLEIFLAHLSTVFRHGELRFQDYEDDLYLGLEDIYHMDQVRILRSMNLSSADITLVTRCFAVLVGVLQAKKRSLTLTLEAVDMIELTILIVQGLMPFRRCLDSESYYQGTGALIAAAECVHLGVPFEYGRGTEGLKEISTLTPMGHRRDKRLRPQFLVRVNERVRNKMWSKQDVWMKAAFTELALRRKEIPNAPDVRKWMVDVMSEGEKHDLFLKTNWDAPCGS